MLYFFCWGKTFLARFDEFWPSQIARILRRANRLFRRRPHDDDLECAAQIRASIIPFVMYDYGLALVLNDDLWTLEIAEFPPHARPGERVRKARRVREQEEKKEQRAREKGAERAARQAEREAAREARRAEKAAKDAAAKKGKKGKKKDAAQRVITVLEWAFLSMFSVLYKIAAASYDKFRQAGRKLASFVDQTRTAVRARPLTVRQQLLRWIVPSHEDCRAARIAIWVKDPLAHGSQRERKLFFADFLPMWLDTITPIESIFVCGGRSVFGERALESECVS